MVRKSRKPTKRAKSKEGLFTPMKGKLATTNKAYGNKLKKFGIC